MNEEFISKLETKVWELRDKIIECLKRKDRDSAVRLQRMGYENVRVLSNENRGGYSALILRVNGEWSVKFLMSGYPLVNPSLDCLLIECAQICDPLFPSLIPSEKELPDRLPSTIEKAVEDQKRKQIEYVRENKIKLLKGFIESMEETLQRISSS